MINHVKFNSNVIENFILEVKNIIDNDFSLPFAKINIMGVVLIFDDIAAVDGLYSKVALLNNNRITSIICDEYFKICNYNIEYLPYENLVINFVFK